MIKRTSLRYLQVYAAPRGMYKRAANGVTLVRVQPRAFRRGRGGYVQGKGTPALREKLLYR